MQILLDDDLGRLTLRRLRPWHRMLARALADRLDRQLAGGARPEASVLLAARAMFLTSTAYRRALAASLRRRLPAAAPAAAELAGLAGSLTGSGLVPARGVAMVSQLLADGGGPLYREGRPGDLSTLVARASQALIS
jgi:hypothetical protein